MQLGRDAGIGIPHGDARRPRRPHACAAAARRARASPTSPTRRSTRRSDAAGGEHRARPSATRLPRGGSRRRCSRASPQRISPRIVESPRPLEPLRRELEEYFEGRRQRFRPAARLVADRARSARSVLSAAAAIPYGSVLTYTEVAAQGGQPARLARSRQRARLQPDPDRHPLPPRAALAAERSAATPEAWTASAGCWSWRALSHPPSADAGAQGEKGRASVPDQEARSALGS